MNLNSQSQIIEKNDFLQINLLPHVMLPIDRKSISVILEAFFSLQGYVASCSVFFWEALRRLSMAVLQRWLLCVSHGPFRAGYYLLIFVPHVQDDGLFFAAGISSNPSQAATFLRHHSTPLGPWCFLRVLLGNPAPPSLLGNISSSSLVLWIPLASLRYFILPSPPNLPLIS